MAYAAPVAPTAEKRVGAHEQHWQQDRIWLSDSVLLLWTKDGRLERKACMALAVVTTQPKPSAKVSRECPVAVSTCNLLLHNL